MGSAFFGFANKVCDMCVLERYALRWLFCTFAEGAVGAED